MPIYKTDAEYLDTVAEFLTQDGIATKRVLALIERGIEAFPESARLWCRRGQLILLAEDRASSRVEDALASYERSAALDPANAEAFEGIGYYHDVFGKDLQQAEKAFLRAIALGAGARSYVGVARVLAELGRKAEALSILRTCPWRDKEELVTLEQEIVDGLWSK